MSKKSQLTQDRIKTPNTKIPQNNKKHRKHKLKPP